MAKKSHEQYEESISEILESVAAMHGIKAAAIVEVNASFQKSLASFVAMGASFGAPKDVSMSLAESFLIALSHSNVLMFDQMTESQIKGAQEFNELIAVRCLHHTGELLDISDLAD